MVICLLTLPVTMFRQNHLQSWSAGRRNQENTEMDADVMRSSRHVASSASAIHSSSRMTGAEISLLRLDLYILLKQDGAGHVSNSIFSASLFFVRVTNDGSCGKVVDGNEDVL